MRTRAKRKRVAEIKLQEVDDMYQILMPGRTMVGENAISMAKEQISGLGSHALIISGKIVEKSGIVKKLTDSLDEAGVSYTIFTDIKGEPDDLMVAAAKKYMIRKAVIWSSESGAAVHRTAQRQFPQHPVMHRSF